MIRLLAVILVCLASASAQSGQMLIFDRAPSSDSNQSLGLAKPSEGFLADDFQVGAAKEDWVIERIRIWAVPDLKATAPHGLGDVVNKISLFGGIAPDSPPPGQKPAADCDCHNLPTIKVATVEPGGNATDMKDVTIATIQQNGSDVWQIDFKDLKWSVPGGTNIQFGVLAESSSLYNWYNLGAAPAQGQHLRVFSSAGKLQSVFQAETPARMNVQVWGHLLARISIRQAGQKLRVVLKSDPFLDSRQVDTTSLRFGPGNASPENVRTEDVNHDGKTALVMMFGARDGIAPNSINACLTGKRLDGAPFEGCDLLKH